jgi:hypothetical protein
MTHIRIAVGIEMFAYSNIPKNSGIAGKYLPINTPAAIHKITQTDKYLLKKLIPVALLLFFIFLFHLF